MSRPKKFRRVCEMPHSVGFSPLCCGTIRPEEKVMTVDEYETVRLIDLEGLTQEEVARQMGVARTTVTGIYTAARRKIADCLVNNKVLTISGGEYVICNESAGVNCCNDCLYPKAHVGGCPKAEANCCTNAGTQACPKAKTD